MSEQIEAELTRMQTLADTAILANGGAEHKKEWCRCDPDVGAIPCEYCAIYYGLKKQSALIVALRRRGEQVKQLIDWSNSDKLQLEYDNEILALLKGQTK